MDKIIVIISILSLFSCSNHDNNISGIWINRDLSSPTILEFTESQWIDNTFHGDTIDYYIKNDSIFVQNPFSQELVGFRYTLSGDSLWTSFPGDMPISGTNYIRAKSDHYFNDLKANLGIDINLPSGSSNIVRRHFGYSIYLPKKSSVDKSNDIYLNNKKLKLDTLFHESIFKLFETEEVVPFELVGLYIDSDLEYQTVRLLKNELRKVQSLRVAYISNPSSDKNYALNTGIIRKLPPIFENDNYYINPRIKNITNKRIPPKPPKSYYSEKEDNKPNVCKVEIINNKIFLDNKVFKPIDYDEKIRIYNPLITYLTVDNESSYEYYYSFIAIQDSLLKRKKNAISRGLYQKEFDQLFETEKIKLVYSMIKSYLIEN